LTGEDNLSTLRRSRRWDCHSPAYPGELEIEGRGLDGLQEPGDVIDCGNSGTTMRLMSGLLAGQTFSRC